MFGNGLKARFLRSTSLSIVFFGTTQFLRLVSNLVLTRILFPEAFGLMALVTVFLTGLTMISDTGISVSIQQHKRGDEADFLDTAWTIQILRGGILWIATWPIGWVISVFYETPLLFWLLPAAGVTLLINSLTPTRVLTAARHLQIGRPMIAEILTVAFGIALTCLLAWWMQTVWALVWGMTAASLVRLGLLHLLVRARKNRLLLDWNITKELLHFGKWILLSSACGFLSRQGDKLVLGKYLTLQSLGIYQIGFFLGGLPQLLGTQIVSQVMLPYLRDRSPAASCENFMAFRRIRLLLTGSLLTITVVSALIGPYFVSLLYDERYVMAGYIMVLISLAYIPLLFVQGYDQVVLSNGDSRGYAGVLALKATLSMSFLGLGAGYAGVIGAVTGLFIANIAYSSVIARQASKYGAWDPRLDFGFALFGTGCVCVTVYIHYAGIIDLYYFWV